MLVDEVVGNNGDEKREDLDADGDENGGRDDVVDEGVDAHESEHVGQDLPNDVGLSNVSRVANVVVHEKSNGGCNSCSDDEPLTKQAPNT
jgi:hypothetical protein